jgi:hypothetical protein
MDQDPDAALSRSLCVRSSTIDGKMLGPDAVLSGIA